MPHSQEQRRQHAMARYLAGDKIEEICRELSCSKSWLYKWKSATKQLIHAGRRNRPEDPGVIRAKPRLRLHRRSSICTGH